MHHSGLKTVILRTFGHKLDKKSDTVLVEGLLEAYYEKNHEKMAKSEIWVIIGGGHEKLKKSNFLLNSV